VNRTNSIERLKAAFARAFASYACNLPLRCAKMKCWWTWHKSGESKHERRKEKRKY